MSNGQPPASSLPPSLASEMSELRRGRLAALAPGPQTPIPALYACVYQPPAGVTAHATPLKDVFTQLAEAFSPRYERHGEHLVTIDVRGLDRLLGSPRTIGEELRRDAADRGLRAHIAIARTRTAARVLALSAPGLRVVEAGQEAAALAPIPIGILEKIEDEDRPQRSPAEILSVLKTWGIRTLGEFAALPSAALSARLGRQGLAWQAIARGEDTRPLVPSRADERFDATLALEWPIEGLEPLSFVLTRLLEPLSTRLEARDRGAAALHIELGLVTREMHRRGLDLPSPLRDVRTLRTLALLDLESHPPAAAIDQVTITIDPTPGRVLQHTLFTRPHPTPEQLSTLLARLGALMGQDRIGAPAMVDSPRPGVFAMKPFAIEHEHDDYRRARRDRRAITVEGSAGSAVSALNVVTALRRCRQPVPARVAVGLDQRPVRVTTDRRSFAGGSVTACVGPWRTSGEWWATGQEGRDRQDGQDGRTERARLAVARSQSRASGGGWDRDEWDVALNDGAVYRIFRDRSTDAWFIEAIVD
jgi:protein ImuB